MIAEVKSGLLLILALVLFVIIIGVLALGTIMHPGRWSERPRHVA